MKLKDLEQYNRIVIQCHDNPDADALASGYALYRYFSSRNKDVKLIYSGRSKIAKSNLVLMIEKLGIDIDYIPFDESDDFYCDGLLITVDSQYGAGNVTKLKSDNVAVIDHHQLEIENIELLHVLSDMGSCSTVVWQLMKEEGYEPDINLSTALYYGLLTDTNNFGEIHNPVDRDMKDALKINQDYISMFCNSNISMEELEIAGIAMIRVSFNEEHNFAVIKSQPCDPNILGVISDFLLQVDKVYACVVFNEIDSGYKFSVRSCVRQVNASDLADYLAESIGSGGGHYQKAGGFISKKLYLEKYDCLHVEAFFNNRMHEYFEEHEIIYADEYEINIDEFERYKKKRLPLGYVIAAEVFDIGTPLVIRTAEGDMNMVVSEDLVIMIGVEGEVYPSRLVNLEKGYTKVDTPYSFETMTVNHKYVPVAKNGNDGEYVHLTDFARTCINLGEVTIYAKRLDKRIKLFNKWDDKKYMLGKVGDMLAVKIDDLQDVYIVDKGIFNSTYEKVLG